MIAIIPSIYLLIKRNIFKIKQKKLKPWYSTIIPEKLLKSILKDEKILYNSAKISNTKALVYLISISYVVVLSLSTFLLLYIADIFDIFIFTIIAIVAGTTIGFFFYTTEQEDKYLIITNNRIYIYYHKQASKSEKVKYYEINSLRGVIFRKRFLDKKGDFGTIDLITEHKNPRRITINNIKNISELQIIVESILYEYGNVEEKWNQMKDDPSYQLPQSYKVSQKRLKANRKSQMRYLIINIFILIICFVIGLIITISITLEFNEREEF